VYISKVQVYKPKAIKHGPFCVPVTAVLTAIMRKQFIRELECSSFIVL